MSARKNVATVIGASALGVALSLVLSGVGNVGRVAAIEARPPHAQPSPARRASTASTTAPALGHGAPSPSRRHARRAAPPVVIAAADEALCRRAAAAGEGGSEGIASSPANDAAIVAAKRRIDAAMRASGEPLTQAVAAWLDAGNEAPAFRERQEHLARLAQASGDARVYALAWRECLKGVEDEPVAACQALSARQWAQVDAGNAMPWVYVLGEAVARGDALARDEALYQIASSPRIEDRPFVVAHAILDHAEDGGAGLVAANELLTQAVGMAAAQRLPLDALRIVCRGVSREDANVAQMCAGAADLLMNRSDTLSMRAIGAAIDGALTGDGARRDRLREETARIGVAAPSLNASQGCASLRDAQAYLRRAGELGEVDALRERAMATDASGGKVGP